MLGFEPEYVPARGQRVREGRIDRSGRQRIATSTPSRPSSANCAAPSEAPTSYDAVRGDTGGKTAGCGPRQGFGSGSPKAGPRRIKRKRSEPGTLIRGATYSNRARNGERKDIGRFREVNLSTGNQVEALIPKGAKGPEGEPRSGG